MSARSLITAADAVTAQFETMRSALEQIRRLHTPLMFPWLDSGRIVQLCGLCCFDESERQTQDCIDSHQHDAETPGCSTAEIITRAGL